jgi:hypothetical protein
VAPLGRSATLTLPLGRSSSQIGVGGAQMGLTCGPLDAPGIGVMVPTVSFQYFQPFSLQSCMLKLRLIIMTMRREGWQKK